MLRIIRPVLEEEKNATLDFVERVFTESEDAESGRVVRRLVAEIRSKKYYVPDLDLVMVDEENNLLGYAMFSRFHIEGRYEDELLMITPVAVRTDMQRQHISKELLEWGLARAKEMGFRAVFVEGNPQNYRARGFQTSANFGIYAHESVGLPHADCMMIQELTEGALDDMHGEISYGFYENLS